MSNQTSSIDADNGSGSKPGRSMLKPEGSDTMPHYGGDVDIGRLIFELWRNKGCFLAIVFAFVLPTVLYLFVASEWFRAEVVLIPSEDGDQWRSTARMGALANLAGIEIGRRNSNEPIAILQSTEFIRDFIESENLLPVLFAEKWDFKRASWNEAVRSRPPDWQDGVQLFKKKIISVTEHRKTGLVSLRVEWTDPVAAANWANLLVARLNSKMRDRAIEDASVKIDYLNVRLTDTQLVVLRQAMAGLLESELQRLMVAQGNKEFAFRTVDVAIPSKYPVRPARIKILATAFLSGLIAATMTILFLRREVVTSK